MDVAHEQLLASAQKGLNTGSESFVSLDARSGVQWGMATDGQKVYVANSDVFVSENGRPGLFALDPATGKDIWYTPSPKIGCSWTGAPCINAQSAAPFAIPGVIFAGTTDGHDRAYAATDGRIL